MKESLSIKVILEEALSLKKILSLHQLSKNYSGMIYIDENHKRVNLNNLPKLVSFMLTFKNHEIRFVMEGPNARQKLTVLQDVIKSQPYLDKQVFNASLEISI